ncbi:hypothetical protein GOBAR_DD26100 [Gossypium barbadense]|nr:hypothetical protein GOBAR_DD26100 [Gossypium barbadense]
MNGNGNGNGRRRRREVEETDKGLIWKLPQLKLKEVGKVGPAFGLGAGCGLGFGIGLVGESNGTIKMHSNLDEIGGLIDELVINTKKVAVAASREIEKWRR